MRQSLVVAGLVGVLAVGIGLWEGNVAGQGEATVTVVCAPCPGEPFGMTGPGMVLMDAQQGAGTLWFYPLDKSAAVAVPSGQFAVGPSLQTQPQRIGRLRVGGPLAWTK